MSAEKKVKQPITKGVAKVPVVMQMEVWNAVQQVLP